MATATDEPVRLPPGVRAPRLLQGAALLTAMSSVLPAWQRRYGDTFTVNLPMFGPTVVVSNAALVKEVFSAGAALIDRPTHLGAVFGAGSTFSLNGDEHSRRRKMLLPALHGKWVAAYGELVEQEAVREIRRWPEGREFSTLAAMNRITLNTILRAVFGAQGPTLDRLRADIPPAITLGSRLHMLPALARSDFGRWSPGGRLASYRRRIDAVIAALIADARADPDIDTRTDLLALLVSPAHDGQAPLTDREIADELLTLVAAGQETTAAALAWTVERLRRHPQVLRRLTAEADAGGGELRRATIAEVLRTRQAVDATMRITKVRLRLGQWVVPADTHIIISIALAHRARTNFADPDTFDPDRFIDASPPPFAWTPFGGGAYRCIGAAFANREMDVTLRVLLREVTLSTSTDRSERRRSRGVAVVPARGGLAVVYRRRRHPPAAVDSVDTTATVAGEAHGLTRGSTPATAVPPS